jgi:hypothetical protein
MEQLSEVALVLARETKWEKAGGTLVVEISWRIAKRRPVKNNVLGACSPIRVNAGNFGKSPLANHDDPISPCHSQSDYDLHGEASLRTKAELIMR